MSDFFNMTAPVYKEKKMNQDLASLVKEQLDAQEQAIEAMLKHVLQLDSEMNQSRLVQKKINKALWISMSIMAVGLILSFIY